MDDVAKCTAQLMSQLTRCVPSSTAGPDYMCEPNYNCLHPYLLTTRQILSSPSSISHHLPVVDRTVFHV
jgi:hypothetical protein